MALTPDQLDDFVNTTDSLQANRDKLTDIETDTAEIGSAGAGLTEAGGTGDQLTALATQASVDVVDSNVDAILVDTGTTLDAALAVVDANVDAIKAKADQLTFTVSNVLDSNILYVIGDAIKTNSTSTTNWGGS